MSAMGGQMGFERSSKILITINEMDQKNKAIPNFFVRGSFSLI
jgi:hypothetical protein